MKRTAGYLATAVALGTACIYAGCARHDAGQPSTSTTACDAWGDDAGTCDDQQYEALQQQLDQNRTPYLQVDAANLQAAGSLVYWLDFTNSDPTLHRADETMQGRVDYGFGVGDADAYNFRASATLVVTAEAGTGVVHAYDAAQSNAPIASATLPAVTTTSGVAWWPYAVDGDTVYVLAEPQAGADALYRWQPRQGGQPVQVTTLQSAGVNVTELESLSVSGNTAMIVDGNGLWSLDLQANEATLVGGQTSVGSAVDSQSDGITFTFTDAADDEVLGFWDAPSGNVRDLSDELVQSTYSINDTYGDAHQWNSGGFARWGRWIVYGADLGVFGYDLDTKAVEPVLLEPATTDQTLRYLNPVVLPDGTMLVTAFSDASTYVGEQGPVYAVSLPAVLK